MTDKFERTQSIVEELRADIDFELDDVIAKIVDGLPDDYFTSLSPADQLQPLKALLAMGICHLNDEIMMRSESGRQVAVVARHNYPGQLADIIRRLPEHQSMVGAKIFTSTDHDFIIDVFDFSTGAELLESELTAIARKHLVEEVAQLSNQAESVVEAFVSHYPPGNPILNSASHVAEQLLAFQKIEKNTSTSILWRAVPSRSQTRITVSMARATARGLFQCTAEFLAAQRLDIERAWLHEIPLGGQEGHSHVAIASFLVADSVPPDVAPFRAYLDQRFGESGDRLG